MISAGHGQLALSALEAKCDSLVAQLACGIPQWTPAKVRLETWRRASEGPCVTHNLYLIVVVGFRVFGLIFAIRGIYNALVVAPLGLGHAYPSIIGAVLASLLGIVLWFIAKPVGRTVTSNLD